MFEGMFGRSSSSSSSGGTGGIDLSDMLGGMFGSSSFDNLPSMRGFNFKQDTSSSDYEYSQQQQQQQYSAASRLPPFEKPFECTLEELFTGCKKRYKVSENVIDTMTGQRRTISHTYEINVKPG
jgi:DnaJ-class molecular chaperone